MRIEAPYPNSEHIIILPKPLLLNQTTILDTRQYEVMMDKSVYSYIKRNDGMRYFYRFNLTREKCEELLTFITLHSGSRWQWFDHHDVPRVGYCLTNPQQANAQLGPDHSYGSSCSSRYYNVNEKLTFELELET